MDGVAMDAGILCRMPGTARLLVAAALINGSVAIASQEPGSAQKAVQPHLVEAARAAPAPSNRCDQYPAPRDCDNPEASRISPAVQERRITLAAGLGIVTAVLLLVWMRRRSASRTLKPRTPSVARSTKPDTRRNAESAIADPVQRDNEDGWKPDLHDHPHPGQPAPAPELHQESSARQPSEMVMTGEVRQFEISDRMIWRFRIERYDDYSGQRQQPVDVEAKYIQEGKLSDGDRVQVAGTMVAGLLEARHIENLTTRTLYQLMSLQEVISLQKRQVGFTLFRVAPLYFLCFILVVGIICWIVPHLFQRH